MYAVEVENFSLYLIYMAHYFLKLWLKDSHKLRLLKIFVQIEIFFCVLGFGHTGIISLMGSYKKWKYAYIIP